MNSQLEKVNNVLRTDLSAIVQRVSMDQIVGIVNIVIFFLAFSIVIFIKSNRNVIPEQQDGPRHFQHVVLLLLLQGYSALNDTPHMVIEQTRSVVESKF